MESLLHVAHGVKVLVEAFLVDAAELALDVLDVPGGGVEDAAIERQSSLGLLDFRPVGRRKETLENAAIVGGCWNVHPERVPGERRGAHSIRPGKDEGVQIGRADVLGRHLVHGNGIGLCARDEVDVVTGQPAVGVNVTADAPLDMRESGQHRKLVAVRLQWLVRGGDGVFRAGVLGEPVVLADRSRDVETGEAGWILGLGRSCQGFPAEGLEEWQGQGGAQTTEYFTTTQKLFSVHNDR